LILPLTPDQLELLDQTLDKDAKPVRFLADGRCCNICTGDLCSKGSNIMYHPIYWDRPICFVSQVVRFLRENNKNVKITVRR